MTARETGFRAIHFAAMIILGIILIFPLLYLVTSSFKSNFEIFGSIRIFPQEILFDGFINGWRGVGGVGFGQFLTNTFRLVIPTVTFTVLSCLIVGYGFSRFDFPLKRFLFVTMLSLMMLPSTVTIIPRYLLFARFGWIDTYYPFWVPSMLATSSFFIFMFIQFFRSLPRELDEAATIDGCGSFTTLVFVLIPLCIPAIMAAAIFTFLWTWNDFFSQFLFISSLRNFTVALGLRVSIDAAHAIVWRNILAMSLVSMLPSALVFLFLQRFFIQGIATSGLKG